MTLLADPPVSLEQLRSLCLAELSASELQQVLRDCAHLHGEIGAIESVATSALARLSTRGIDGAATVEDWLARETNMSAGEAKRQVERSKLIEALPEAADALATGAVSAAQLDVLAAVVPAPLQAQAGELLGSGLRPEALRHTAQRWVHEHTGDDGARQLLAQKQASRLKRWTEPDGVAHYYANLAPDDDAVLDNALDHWVDVLWRRDHPDRNPSKAHTSEYQHRRARALIEMARASLAPYRGNDPTPTASTASTASKRAVPTVVAVIDYQSLCGQLGIAPIAELIDRTPLPIETIRRMACDANILPAVLNGRSEILDLGRSRRFPTDAQRSAVLLRHRRCRFPGCHRKAGWNEVHHIDWWEAGGKTDVDNLLGLCSFHHHLVHEGGWRLKGSATAFTVHRPDGTLFRGPP